MSLNQLANCPQCGKLFVKGVRSLCPDCFRTEEDQFNKVSEYLRNPENKKVTIQELSDATEVSVKLITKFIRQGRISLKGLPNMGYPCESCGQMTTEGKLCAECRTKFTSKINKLKEVVEQQPQEKEDLEQGYEHIKYSFSKRNR